MDKLRAWGHSRWREELQGREGSKRLLPRCLHHLFSKALLSTFCIYAKNKHVGFRDRGGKANQGDAWVLGTAAKPRGFHPTGPSTQLMIWGEEPLSWRNRKEVVNGGAGVPGPGQRPETHLSEWRRGREWRQRAGWKDRCPVGADPEGERISGSQIQPFLLVPGI